MEFVFNSILAFVLCYFIGSFPSAYVYVRMFSGRDVRSEGSGNVGTLNSFQVTKSKSIGILVLITDYLKGFLPIYFMLFVIRTDFSLIMLGSFALILGHNYPLWLKFKGGRGLATGAGIFTIINFYVVAGWCVIWCIVFLIKRKVLTANTVATVGLVPIIITVVIAELQPVKNYVDDYSYFYFYFTFFSLLISVLILSRHTEVFRYLIKK